MPTANRPAPPIRARLLATPQWFAAVFPSTCGICGKRYTKGTALRLPAPRATGWVAECCAEDGAQ